MIGECAAGRRVDGEGDRQRRCRRRRVRRQRRAARLSTRRRRGYRARARAGPALSRSVARGPSASLAADAVGARGHGRGDRHEPFVRWSRARGLARGAARFRRRGEEGRALPPRGRNPEGSRARATTGGRRRRASVKSPGPGCGGRGRRRRRRRRAARRGTPARGVRRRRRRNARGRRREGGVGRRRNRKRNRNRSRRRRGGSGDDDSGEIVGLKTRARAEKRKIVAAASRARSSHLAASVSRRAPWTPRSGCVGVRAALRHRLFPPPRAFTLFRSATSFPLHPPRSATSSRPFSLVRSVRSATSSRSTLRAR